VPPENPTSVSALCVALCDRLKFGPESFSDACWLCGLSENATKCTLSGCLASFHNDCSSKLVGKVVWLRDKCLFVLFLCLFQRKHYSLLMCDEKEDLCFTHRLKDGDDSNYKYIGVGGCDLCSAVGFDVSTVRLCSDDGCDRVVCHICYRYKVFESGANHVLPTDGSWCCALHRDIAVLPQDVSAGLLLLLLLLLFFCWKFFVLQVTWGYVVWASKA